MALYLTSMCTMSFSVYCQPCTFTNRPTSLTILAARTILTADWVTMALKSDESQGLACRLISSTSRFVTCVGPNLSRICVCEADEWRPGSLPIRLRCDLAVEKWKAVAPTAPASSTQHLSWKWPLQALDTDEQRKRCSLTGRLTPTRWSH